MNQFCSKCGWLGNTFTYGDLIVSHLHCPDCKADSVKWTKEYLIPVYDKDTGLVEQTSAALAIRLMQNFPERWSPVPDNDGTFNIKVNGEWNGVPIGKKIQEKNEQLKRKVSGYENEQRNVRADVERQLTEKRAQQNTK